MTFSILFWNIWLDNQMNGESEAKHLLDELQQLTDRHSPDFVALNEVLQHTQSKTLFVSDFLSSKCGYRYSHYAPASPLSDDWLIGAALYSRQEFDAISDHFISQDTPAKVRGYAGWGKKAVLATVTLPNGQVVKVVVAHPMHLRPNTIRDHYEATNNLDKLMRTSEYKHDTVLIGDFNEPGFMPRAFKDKISDIMHFRTGTSTNPTWRHNGWRVTPVRANLDQMYWSKQSDFNLKSFEVIESMISDHKPLLAVFEYTPR